MSDVRGQKSDVRSGGQKPETLPDPSNIRTFSDIRLMTPDFYLRPNPNLCENSPALIEIKFFQSIPTLFCSTFAPHNEQDERTVLAAK
jgi:hypothetical protein